MRDGICLDRDMRGKRRWHAGDGAIAELAERQHGVVARRQLTALGLGSDGAVLSHRSAGALWGILGGGSSIEVTTPRGQRPRRGIRFHRCRLPEDEITASAGIPVTTVPRTLFDMAADTDLRRLERAINEAEVLRLWDELSLDDLLRRTRAAGAAAR